MTRRGTVIRHDIMTSESVASMKQDHKLVWMALIMCSDDWGRLADKPAKISMRCPAFNLSFELVREGIDAFVNDDLIIRYTGRLPAGNHEITILQLASWEEHQKWLKSRDYPEYPDVNGKVEKTTNPLALHKEKEKNKKKSKKKEKEKVRTVTKRSPSGEDVDKKVKHLESVYLKNSEYQKLVEKYTKEITDGAIEILNNYKMANGKKYKSDYHAMINWVIDKAQQSSPNKPKENPF